MENGYIPAQDMNKYDVVPYTLELRTTVDGQEYAVKFGNDSSLLDTDLKSIKGSFLQLLRRLGKFHPEVIHDKQETPEMAAPAEARQDNET